MTIIPFTGIRGTGDWATDQRPKNWREMILKQYPNGMAPLTALLSMMKSESTDDPEFNWWTKVHSTQSGAVTGVYTDAAMTTAYVSGGVIGTVLYVKVAEATAKEIRPGHQVLLRDQSDIYVDVNAYVTGVTLNGANSQIAVSLTEADDNSTSGDLSDCDFIKVVGNANSEGSTMPNSINYDPEKFYNYTQIFITPFDITRTAMKTRLRTGDAYQELKAESMEYHSVEMEKAFLHGVRYETIGENGKPMRFTNGLIPWTKAYGVTGDYTTDTDYAGDAWTTSGQEWLDKKLEEVFRYGETQKLAFCGSGALLGIQRLARTYGQINLQPGAAVYGLKVVEWVTPFGSIFLKTHPLFSQEASSRNTVLIFEPKNITERYITNTTFVKEGDMQNTGANWVDGKKEAWLTETGLEVHFPNSFAFLSGFNTANPL